jgi:predicted XRE-type DNA-binding protein
LINSLIPVKKRLGRILFLLAHFGKEGVPQTIIAEISQETLADMIGTTRSRVSFFMNRFGKEERSENVILKISQETLAGMVGTTRARINFFINRFRQLALIDYNGGLEVHSSLLDIVLHE